MADAEGIREALHRHCPPTVPTSDVEALVARWFHGHWHSAGSGSHLIVIEHPWLWPPLYTGEGTLSLPVHKGSVKQVYVRRLLKAIAVVEAGRKHGADETKRLR